jgi:hypothetical protein
MDALDHARVADIQAVATHTGAKRRNNGSCTHCGSNSIVSRGGRPCR